MKQTKNPKSEDSTDTDDAILDEDEELLDEDEDVGLEDEDY
ncbi:MAG: hypothetical protein Q7S33_01910 [Nanoarchaeota archaeon]|nr:hypothetical protein [Nanoarchaeota archaeon]